MANKIKICAKGSRKLGQEFIEESKYLASLVNCIEIDFNYPHDDNFKKEINFLKKLQTNKKINYTVHAQYLNGSLNDLNKKIRQETTKLIYNSIDTAKEINAKIVTLHPALEPYGLKLEKRKQLELDSYKKIVAYAKRKGIKIGLENEAQTCFWFPDRACRFDLLMQTIKAVNQSNFGLTLDIGHASVSGENYLLAIKKFGKKILHIHAHDNLGSPEKNLPVFKRPDPHLAPGKGRIDWVKVIQVLKQIKYNNFFELECEIHEMAEAVKFIKSL
ncbi:MAG: sugar phosphate isomerase/epimerase family protein [Patescibacteria group bacterium]